MAAPTRTWAIQKLQSAPAPKAAPGPHGRRRRCKTATATGNAATGTAPRVPRAFSKQAIVRDLLVRTGGVTLPPSKKGSMASRRVWSLAAFAVLGCATVRTGRWRLAWWDVCRGRPMGNLPEGDFSRSANGRVGF